MAKVRVFEAATEGFRLIRREPKAVFSWGAVLALVLGVPITLLVRSLTPMMMDATRVAETGGGLPSFAATMIGLTPLIWILSLLAYTVLVGAVLRAILTPDDRRFLYLRLGKAELWMVLSAIVGFIIVYIGTVVAIMIAAVVLAIPLALLSKGGEMSGIHWAIVLAIVPGYVASIYVMLRFSMAPIMSFDQRRFRLFEAWRFTRGEGWRLLGLAVVMCLALIAVEFVVLALTGMLSIFGRAMIDPTAAEAFAEKMFAFYGSPLIWLGVLVGALLGGPYMALMFAPWARVYLMLKDNAPGATDAAETQA